MSIFDRRNTLPYPRLEYVRLQLLILAPKHFYTFLRYSGIPPLKPILHPHASLSLSIPLRGFNIIEIYTNRECQLNNHNAAT